MSTRKLARILFFASLAALAATLLIPASHTRAASFVVTNTNDHAADACDAECTLRDAVVAANAAAGPDTITFAVTGTITLTVNTQIDITDSLTITGPGAGSLIVSGNGGSRIFAITAGDTVSISGITVQNGISTSAGGGIHNAGSLTLNNVIMRNNLADNFVVGSGGGVYNDGTLIVANSTFDDNRARLIGGAIYNNLGDSLTVSTSTFTSNDALVGEGGAIYDFVGVVDITSSSFTGNTALFNGAALQLLGSGTVNNSVISGNTASDSAAGIFAGGSVTVTSSTLTGNTATNYGGAIRVDTGSLTMSGTLVSGNTAAAGGAIFVANGGSGSATGNCFETNTTTGSLGASYDVDRYNGTTTFNGNWWGVATGSNQPGGETFGIFLGGTLNDAAPQASLPNCGAVLPTVGAGAAVGDCVDDRLNCRVGDEYAAVYARRDSSGGPVLHVYCLSASGRGHLALIVAQEDFEGFPAQPADNTQVLGVGQAQQCRVPVSVWVLATGEYQINIGPDAKGDLIRIIFNGLPPSGVYFRKCNVITSPVQCDV